MHILLRNPVYPHVIQLVDYLCNRFYFARSYVLCVEHRAIHGTGFTEEKKSIYGSNYGSYIMHRSTYPIIIHYDNMCLYLPINHIRYIDAQKL